MAQLKRRKHIVKSLDLLDDAGKIEKILRELLPPEESNDFCHRLVLHGRAVCKAPTPVCGNCTMQDFCPKNK